MQTPRKPELRFLWHPGQSDTFSGYGLVLSPRRLAGLLMIDRPEIADPRWLTAIEHAFGGYEIAPMTHGGARGIICQMLITPDSLRHLRSVTHPRERAIRAALAPLLAHPPRVTLALTWSPAHRCWVSQIAEASIPLFPLGQVVATQGALRALERAEQSPIEFLDRHVQGDWGDLDEVDRQENAFSVQYGYRILSAYMTSAGDKLWIITEADRSVTTLLTPDEY